MASQRRCPRTVVSAAVMSLPVQYNVNERSPGVPPSLPLPTAVSRLAWGRAGSDLDAPGPGPGRQERLAKPGGVISVWKSALWRALTGVYYSVLRVGRCGMVWPAKGGPQKKNTPGRRQCHTRAPLELYNCAPHAEGGSRRRAEGGRAAHRGTHARGAVGSCLGRTGTVCLNRPSTDCRGQLVPN